MQACTSNKSNPKPQRRCRRRQQQAGVSVPAAVSEARVLGHAGVRARPALCLCGSADAQYPLGCALMEVGAAIPARLAHGQGPELSRSEHSRDADGG